MASSGSKTCSICKKSLPTEAFHRCRTNTDGLQYSCKACLETKRQARKSKDPEGFAKDDVSVLAKAINYLNERSIK